MSYNLVLGSALLLLLFVATLFAATKKESSLTVRKIVLLGCLTSIAIVASILEGMLPDVLLPGMKIGFANLIVLLCLVEIGWKQALAVDLLRVLLAGLLRGSFLSMGFWMSLTGAVASFLAMALLLGLYKKASLFFVSVIGALFHSFAQVLVCFLYLGNVGTVYYLPLLALFSIGAGLVIAAIAKGVIRTKALRKALQ